MCWDLLIIAEVSVCPLLFACVLMQSYRSTVDHPRSDLSTDGPSAWRSVANSGRDIPVRNVANIGLCDVFGLTLKGVGMGSGVGDLLV